MKAGLHSSTLTSVPWITNDMIGAKVDPIGGDVAPKDIVDEMKALHSAIKSAARQSRWLRCLHQWNVIFDRFAVAAHCTDLLTLPHIMNYRSTIHKLAGRVLQQTFSNSVHL